MRIFVRRQQFEDPGWFKQLMGNPVFGFGWFFLRLYLGFQWLEAGWHKVYGDSSIGWVKDGMVKGQLVHGGDNLLGFWKNAAGMSGRPATITFEWYQDVLKYMVNHSWNGWFTYLIAYGELLIGIGLVVGAFTGIAAIFGATLNLNFMLAGTSSSNPLLFTIAIVMILAWKTAGYVGVDRWLLPMFGTPWQAGKIFHRAPSAPTARPTTGMRGVGA